MKSAPSTIMMIRPFTFGFNDETSSTNAFQQRPSTMNDQRISQLALCEFDSVVKELTKHEIDVIVFEDTAIPHTPDAVFPNNWISVHADGTLILYPMQAWNRRLERRPDIIASLQSSFQIHAIYDLSHHESQGTFLEGTGSIVFDHEHKIAYAALSERTDHTVFLECCAILGYHPMAFRAFHTNGQPVYHTNVLMHISQYVSAICLEMIHHEDRKRILDTLQSTHHHPIILSEEQVHAFAGNMLTVHDRHGKPYLIGSRKGFSALTDEQLSKIDIHHIPLDIPTIEMIGGGSARCMIAEIFLPKRLSTKNSAFRVLESLP